MADARFIVIPNTVLDHTSYGKRSLIREVRRAERLPWKLVDTQKNWDAVSFHKTKLAAERAAIRRERMK